MKDIKSIILLLCFIVPFYDNIFALNNDSLKVNLADTTESGIYYRVMDFPKFVGGTKGLMLYLQQNLKYPSEAKQLKFEGKVVVRFYIDIDGSAKDPIVIYDGVGGGADIEAIRLVKAMPKWIPGTQEGKPVKVYYTLPINFHLY